MNRIVAKMSLEHQLHFKGFTQDDVSVAFDAIHSQLKHDRNNHVYKRLLASLYTLAKKSNVPQHELVVHEISSINTKAGYPPYFPSFPSSLFLIIGGIIEI